MYIILLYEMISHGQFYFLHEMSLSINFSVFQGPSIDLTFCILVIIPSESSYTRTQAVQPDSFCWNSIKTLGTLLNK